MAKKKTILFGNAIRRTQVRKKTSDKPLPNVVFETSSLMLNENSGFDMKCQINKLHNLKLTAKTINKVVIAPNETFSFWQLVRWADCHEKYKDGLNIVDGKIVGSCSGGLCQLSNMLFWLFLHTPLTIVERHGHAVESFPSTTEDLPCGTDATINEGWLDLKLCNDTDIIFQIEINFDNDLTIIAFQSQALIDNPTIQPRWWGFLYLMMRC